jgi:hypothetical protein
MGTKKLGDKIAILWSRTGSRPEDVAITDPVEKTDLNDFHKYAPPLTTVTKLAGTTHYLLMLLYFLWFMGNVAQLSYLATSSNVLMLALSGITIGALFDGKSYALRLELFRLCALGVFLTAAGTAASPPLVWISLGLGYGILSGAAMTLALLNGRGPLQEASST